MKPEIIEKAAERLTCLRYFPTGEVAREEIMRLLDRMVGTAEQLAWLIDTMIDRVGEWRGPVELRGVHCTRFTPKDRIDAWCSQTPGFTPDDQEMLAIEGNPDHPRQVGPGDQKLLAAAPATADPEMEALLKATGQRLRMHPPTGGDLAAVEQFWEQAGCAEEVKAWRRARGNSPRGKPRTEIGGQNEGVAP